MVCFPACLRVCVPGAGGGLGSTLGGAGGGRALRSTKTFNLDETLRSFASKHGDGDGAADGEGAPLRRHNWLLTVEVVEVPTGQRERASLGLPDDGHGNAEFARVMAAAPPGLELPVLQHGTKNGRMQLFVGAAAISEYLSHNTHTLCLCWRCLT